MFSELWRVCYLPRVMGHSGPFLPWFKKQVQIQYFLHVAWPKVILSKISDLAAHLLWFVTWGAFYKNG